jgi:hypothetical protein
MNLNNPILWSFALTCSVQAELVDDFDTPGPLVTLTQRANPPGPVVTNSPPDTNNFLRLVNDLVINNHNHYSYDLTDTGAYETIEAWWDFRGTSLDPGADGYHFMLVPTAAYGTSGDGPAPTSEEPNVVNTFAVGVDFHPAGTVNDLSMHWNNVEHLNSRPPVGDLDIDNGAFHRAHLFIDRMGNSSIARLELSPNVLATNASAPFVVWESIVPMMLPYENRVQFGGRTGGSNMDIDLDNIHVSWTNKYLTPVPSISTNRLYQDFDLAGATDFVVSQFTGSTASAPRPGPLPRDDAPGHGVYLRLLHDNVPGGKNAISFDHVQPALASSYRYGFDFRINSQAFAADGMGISFLPIATYGLRGAGNDPATGASEEPNTAGVLAIGIDLHDESAGVNDLSVHYDSQELLNLTLDPATVFDWNTGGWSRLEIVVDAATNGTAVSVLIHPDIEGTNGTVITAIDRFVVTNLPGLYPHRLMLGARSGGRYMDVDIDNISGMIGDSNQVGLATVQDFDGVDTTGYEVWAKPDGVKTPPPELRDDGASNGRYLRLLKDSTQNHRNSLLFNQSPDGRDLPTQALTTAVFDFRIQSGDTNNPADGFAFMLIPTDTYGTSGPGAHHTYPGLAIEAPLIAGVLGIGIDVYNESLGVNDLGLYWDATQVAKITLPDSTIDFDDGFFHRLQCTIDWSSTGSTVSVSLATNILGTAGGQTNLMEHFIPGLTPYDYRVEFGARTGGATIDLDLDNISVATTPTGIPDSDLDGLPDAWELTFFGNLTTSSGSPGEDFDNDGFDDRSEFLAGTHPADTASLLEINATRVPGGQRVTWKSVDGIAYRLWRTGHASGTWSSIQGGIPGTAPVNMYFDPTNLQTSLLYRVEVEP